MGTKLLITVKTYPIPSAKYDELVCTAGVTEAGDFVRIYPINFRDLPYDKQFRKYQWIELELVGRHVRDVRKESFRPNYDTIRLIGEPVSTGNGDWAARARFVLAKRSNSLEELMEKNHHDWTSMGVFKPKRVHDFVIEKSEDQWKAGFLNALKQERIWEERKMTLEPPRKVPFKFSFKFGCNDPRCKNGHKLMIEDWEVGALYWKLIDQGATPHDACQGVRKKFLEEICGPNRDTYFFVGTVSAHPRNFVIIGIFWPKLAQSPQSGSTLFDGM